MQNNKNYLEVLKSLNTIDGSVLFALYVQHIVKLKIEDPDFEYLKEILSKPSSDTLKISEVYEKAGKELDAIYGSLKSNVDNYDNLVKCWNENKVKLSNIVFTDDANKLAKLLEHINGLEKNNEAWLLSEFLGDINKTLKSLDNIAGLKEALGDIAVELSKLSKKEEIKPLEYTANLGSVQMEDITLINIDGKTYEGYENILKEIDKAAIKKDKDNKDKDNKGIGQNILFTGVPGTGKTVLAEAYVDYKIREAITSEKLEDAIKNRKLLISFNKNTDYSNFICGLRANKNGFEVHKGIFTTFCDKAKADANNMYYCIIDEFSRGDAESILGEAFTLIEKRGQSMPTKFPEIKIEVPKNLVIIATMNSADASTKNLDKATKDRFNRFNIEPIWNHCGTDSNEKCFEAVRHIAFGDKAVTGRFKDAFDIMSRIDTELVRLNENDKRIGTRALQTPMSTEDDVVNAIRRKLIPSVKDIVDSLKRKDTKAIEDELAKLKKLAE